MNFEIENTLIADIKIIKPKIYKDDRGWFIEVFNADSFEQLGLPSKFVQMNHSFSKKGVIRGLHFQWDPPMGKLMRVTKGEAFLVAADIRKNSPTLGKWYGRYFNEFDKIQLWAPAGFARGFCAISDYAEIQYLITGIYNPANESEIIWNDQDLNIDWPIKNPMLTKKDQNAQTFKQWLNSENSNKFML